MYKQKYLAISYSFATKIFQCIAFIIFQSILGTSFLALSNPHELSYLQKEPTCKALHSKFLYELENHKIKSYFINPLFISPVTRAYNESSKLSLTCPQETSLEDIVILSDPVFSFNEKVKALSGKTLPEEWIEEKNFEKIFNLFNQEEFKSSLPKIEEIFISYLTYRRDFSGRVIEKLLRLQAERGAKIKIITSETSAMKKEKYLLRRLEEDFSHVEIIFYRAKMEGFPSPKNIFEYLHRSQHIKLFLVTYNADESLKNLVVTGGRNIHDGFLFDHAPNYLDYPEMQQYKLESPDPNCKRKLSPGPRGQWRRPARCNQFRLNFIKWTDLEVMIHNDNVIQEVKKQFLNFWFYSKGKEPFKSHHHIWNEKEIDPKSYFREDKTYIRHLVSIPYEDNLRLERFYVGLFDNAEKSIILVTPYLRLTLSLRKSLERALKRGVNVKILTRTNLTGDFADIIMNHVNKKDINRFYKDVQIYDFKKEKDILHSKFMLIDEELSVVGSINLNQRSFFHDTENTFLIWSPSFYKKMEDVVREYLEDSERIQQELEIPFLRGVLIELFEEAF